MHEGGEERNKAESVPARSEEGVPAEAAAGEAFRTASEGAGRKQGGRRSGRRRMGAGKRVQENKAGESGTGTPRGRAKTERTGGQPENDGQGTILIQGEKVLLINSLSWKTAALVLILAVAVPAGIYAYKALGYRNTYFPIQLLMGWTYQGKP